VDHITPRPGGLAPDQAVAIAASYFLSRSVKGLSGVSATALAFIAIFVFNDLVGDARERVGLTFEAIERCTPEPLPSGIAG